MTFIRISDLIVKQRKKLNPVSIHFTFNRNPVDTIKNLFFNETNSTKLCCAFITNYSGYISSYISYYVNNNVMGRDVSKLTTLLL